MRSSLDALRALGLTEYGARAYAALASLGPSGAAAVAQAGPVPRTKVYAVLGDLVARRWAAVEPGRPKTWRAVRPRDCFERERARLGALLDAALPALESSWQERGTRFAGPLWILQGREVLAQRTLALVEGARREVALVASFPLPGDDRALARALRAAVRRGVRVRLVVPDPDAPHARALAVAGAEVRVASVPPRVLLADGAQVLMCVPREGESGPDATGMWNPSADLVEMLAQGVLQGLWDSAEPLAARPPAPRPRAPRRRDAKPAAREG